MRRRLTFSPKGVIKMRAIANRMIKIALLVLSLAIISIFISSSFAGPKGRVSSSVPQDKSDGVVDSYCERDGVDSIINLESYSLANKVKVENGCIKIVRDGKANTNKAYAKSVEEE